MTRSAHARAKLNLYLEILGKRRDGFHELETLMVPISLADSLTLTPTPAPTDGQVGDIELEVRHCWPARSRVAIDAIPTGAANLVVKAVSLLRARAGCRLGARIELVKRIPSSAGLGGGSSDAAAALRLANHGWRLNWSCDELSELAAEIGSDVPFFLGGTPAVCRGRGERVERVRHLPVMHFVIVKPPVALNTAEVYQAHDKLNRTASSADTDRQSRATTTLRSKTPERFADWMHNGLQAAAATLSPWVARLQTVFEEFDCLAHQLSGSGSAYFGVCRHAQQARRLATLLRMRQLGLVYATKSYR